MGWAGPKVKGPEHAKLILGYSSEFADAQVRPKKCILIE